MRIRIVWAALGAWAASLSVIGAAGAAALQSTIDTSGDYRARRAVQTLIDERAPAASTAELEVPAPAEVADVNELMSNAAEQLGGSTTDNATDAGEAEENIEQTIADEAPVPVSANTPVRQAASHQFDDCSRPLRPDFAVRPSTSARVIRSRYNREVNQYNDYVREANAYMRCLADEAQRDLDAYYKAVSDALDAEQASMMGELETVREELDERR